MKSVFQKIIFLLLAFFIAGCSKTDFFPSEVTVQGALKGNWQKITYKESEGKWETWNFDGKKTLTIKSNYAISAVHLKEIDENGYFTAILNYTIEANIVGKNKLTIIGGITGRNYGHTWKITTLDDDVLALTADEGSVELIELSKAK